MMKHSYLRAVAAALLLAALAGCAAVKAPEMAPSVPPSQSVADADRKLLLAAQQRAQAEAAFAASEQLCYAKFLVNRCLDSAREKRRLTLAGLRLIEIEAGRYKRQATVDERDRALVKGEEEFKALEARLAAEPVPEETVPAAPKPPRSAPAARVKKPAAQDQVSAAERAASVAAYEKRKRESEERQRKVEEKKKARAAEAEKK